MLILGIGFSYQSAGSASEQTLNGQQIYAGTPADYQEGWATVAAAVKKHAPCVADPPLL